jgi:hypothetical protein
VPLQSLLACKDFIFRADAADLGCLLSNDLLQLLNEDALYSYITSRRSTDREHFDLSTTQLVFSSLGSMAVSFLRISQK